MKTNTNFDIKSRFKAIICQPSLGFLILCVFGFGIIHFLGTTIIVSHSIFALISIAFIIIFLLGFGCFFICKSDTTESIELQQGDCKVIVKSPSRQLMPTIISRLLQNTTRPNGLIPSDIDPKEDPSKFKLLTVEQQEAIVKEEVKAAILRSRK